jgi:hypothetical protein
VTTELDLGKKETPMSNSKAKKAELTLIRVDQDEEAAVAAMFESLTGRKLTEAEMVEVRKTLAEPPEPPTR